MTTDGATGFALVLLVSAASGTLGSAVGMAGGVFLVPVLTLLGHLPWGAAVAASLFAVLASSSAAAPPALAARLPNLRLAVALEVATVLGSLAGVLLLGLAPHRLLYGIFAAVLAASAIQVAARRRPADAADGREWGRRLRLDSPLPGDSGPRAETYPIRRLPAGMVVMFGAGTLSAMLGIGSGVLKIPAMDSALGLPLKVSSATANLMIGATACGTATAFLLRGSTPVMLAAAAALGAIAGSLLGARLLLRLRAAVLRTAMVVILAALTVPMTATALGAAP